MAQDCYSKVSKVDIFENGVDQCEHIAYTHQRKHTRLTLFRYSCSSRVLWLDVALPCTDTRRHNQRKIVIAENRVVLTQYRGHPRQMEQPSWMILVDSVEANSDIAIEDMEADKYWRITVNRMKSKSDSVIINDKLNNLTRFRFYNFHDYNLKFQLPRIQRRLGQGNQHLVKRNSK